MQRREKYRFLAPTQTATGKCLLVAVLFLLLGHATRANNFQISDARVANDNTGIAFTISWDNAWNLDNDSIGNHDAIWFFVKKSSFGSETHLDLSSQDVHLSSDPSVLEVRPVADGKGVFLVPTFPGGGNVPQTTITLKFAETLPDFDYMEFSGYGIEMVYVPQAAFWLGDAASNHSFYAGDSSGPLLIASENELPLGNGPGTLFRNATYGAAADLPAAWPKGHAGFYCMKYEISQAQYADFLSAHNALQQENRTAVPPSAAFGTLALTTGQPHRNGIHIQFAARQGDEFARATYGHDLNAGGMFNDDFQAQNRACNFLNWSDLCAYLDWAALRPMTEFEYEKACRGPEFPQALEFAWGTDGVVDANTLAADGGPAETVTDLVGPGQGLGSHGYNGPQGPLRCGFAAQGSSDRLQAGASYYGIMEMSGNLWEQCVTVNVAGLEFAGQLGDGILGADGNADVAGWPGAEGAGFRGGGWNSGILPGFRDLAVSDRFYAGQAPTQRRNTTGGRGVR